MITAETPLNRRRVASILFALHLHGEPKIHVKLTHTEGDCVLLKLSRLLWILLFACAFVAVGNDRAEADTALASWYGPGFEGSPTASGETFEPYGYTAAHKTLPFGTELMVNYGGRSVQVTVNDRGPYAGGRDLDLSQGAAEDLGLTQTGVDWVDYSVVGGGNAGYDRYGAGYDTGYERGYGGGGGRAYKNAAYEDASYGAGAGRGWRATAAQTSYEPAVGGAYVVQSGDTLYDIALDLGTTVDALAAANGIADPDVLYVGQTLSY